MGRIFCMEDKTANETANGVITTSIEAAGAGSGEN